MWAAISCLVGLTILNDIYWGKPVVVYSSVDSCEYNTAIDVPQGGSCISTRQSIGWPTPAGSVIRTVAKDANGKVTGIKEYTSYGNWSNAGKNRASANNAIIMFAVLPVLYGAYYVFRIGSGKRPLHYTNKN